MLFLSIWPDIVDDLLLYNTSSELENLVLKLMIEYYLCSLSQRVVVNLTPNNVYKNWVHFSILCCYHFSLDLYQKHL